MSDELSRRIAESGRMVAKFPDRIPIIVTSKDKKLSNLLSKNKFLCPKYISASMLLINIRKYINIDSTKALFMFCDKKLICGTEIMISVYEKYISKKNDNDKYLYIEISSENTFG